MKKVNLKYWFLGTALILIGVAYQNCSDGLQTNSQFAQSVVEVGPEIEIVSGNLFPAGDLDDEEDLAKFQNGNLDNSDLLPGLLEGSAKSGLRGLHLKDHTFTVTSENLPVLNVNKYYKVSFWAKFVRLPGVSTPPGEMLPSLSISSGSIGNPSDPATDFRVIAEMEVKTSDWTKVEAIIKPTGPKLHFQYWLMIGTNEADVDEIKIEEVTITDPLLAEKGTWNPILLDDFESYNSQTFKSPAKGDVGNFSYDVMGNLAEMLLSTQFGRSNSMGVRLSKDRVRLIWSFKNIVSSNTRYRVRFDARVMETLGKLPTATVFTDYKLETDRMRIRALRYIKAITVNSSDWKSYELVIEPRTPFVGATNSSWLLFFTDYAVDDKNNFDTFDIDNVSIEVLE